MKEIYDRLVTRYYCDRCGTPIDIPSDALYEFAGADDSHFWCSSCEDLPQAVLMGTPARDLPEELHLPHGFICRGVPLAEPSDVKNWNLIFRPFSTRSFLRQYVDWLRQQGESELCDFRPEISVSATFDTETQQYTTDLQYSISDICGNKRCEFLQTKAVKPVDLDCRVLNMLCDVNGAHALCQTGDEAMILKRYLSLNGAEHYPMLVPQPSLLKGKKRPDFVCFVPLSKFQYERIAVLVDRVGKDPKAVEGETRLYESLGYIVRRIEIDPTSKSYFIQARRLSNWIDSIPRGGPRPPLTALRRSLGNSVSWAKVLSEDPTLRKSIENRVFDEGTFGRFLQDGLKELDDLE